MIVECMLTACLCTGNPKISSFTRFLSFQKVPHSQACPIFWTGNEAIFEEGNGGKTFLQLAILSSVYLGRHCCQIHCKQSNLNSGKAFE